MGYKDAQEIFDAFQNLRVMVIGDAMLDRYISGGVSRISPEAPVPVIKVGDRENRLGGAANVALNILALGAVPVLCTIIGNDDGGNTFLQMMDHHNLEKEGILSLKNRATTRKTRVISGGHHLLRIDDETDVGLNDVERNEFLEIIRSQIEKCDVVVFEDYDKGCLDKKSIEEIIKISAGLGIPTVVDPKKKNFFHYKGVDLFKPNFKELIEGMHSNIAITDIDAISKLIDSLKAKSGFRNLMVTLSSQGIYYQSEKASGHISAHYRMISDVSGAGDTVISLAALSLAVGLPLDVIAEIANLGGGIVCESSGVVPIDRQRLFNEVSNNTSITKFFQS